jgi:putative salt-induced outer membrane protein
MNKRIEAVWILALLVMASGAVWADDAKPDEKTLKEKEAWHGDLAFGLSLAKGNANTLLVNGEAKAVKLWSDNALALGADGQYGLNDWGKSNETKNADNIHGFTEYKRLFTDRFYGSARIDGYHDDIAELHYRVIVGPAAGYYFIKSDRTKFSGEVGPSFIEQRQGSENDNGYVVLRVSERDEYAVSKTAKVWEQVDFMPEVDKLGTYLINAEAGAEAAINTRLSLRIVAKDMFNSEPAANRLRNDITLVSSVVYKY